MITLTSLADLAALDFDDIIDVRAPDALPRLADRVTDVARGLRVQDCP